MGRHSGSIAPSRVELALAFCALATGLVAGVISLQKTWSARGVSERYLVAATHGDVTELRRLSTAEHHRALELELCRPRHAAIRHVYDEVVPRLAFPRWLELRREAQRLARGEEERLRVLIQELGSMGVGRLAATPLQAVIDDTELRQRFVYACGASQLDPADRELVGDPEAFRAGASDVFVVRAAWSAMSQAQRDELGSPKALAVQDFPEKLAFFDAVARPLLAPRPETSESGTSRAGSSDRYDLQSCGLEILPADAAIPRVTTMTPDYLSVIDGVSRDEAATLETFADTHGDETVHAVLLAALAEPVVSGPFRYRDQELGHLFRGSDGVCDDRLTVARSPASVECTLVRRGMKWTVSGLLGLVDRLAG